jgi:hypothetical protein
MIASIKTTIMDNVKLQEWFELSYASFLVLPRVLMQEMPDEWQEKMADLLNEYEDTFDTSDIGIDGTRVQAIKNNKLIKMPIELLNYRHPDRDFINSIRIKERGR